ncbi:hypothetical protein BDW22DRAFT_1430583 [Trametopsis cervina]|nr:hypothetical protein BDW22DRAFT_1430583 [Trametopsis cervina]
MPSQGRHKRHYASDDEGASSFAASRGDKTGSDTHTHSNHHPRQSEKRRHSPSRADMREDVTSSSSRTYRENDERRTADDRYDYTPSKDGRRHGRRDDNDQRAKDSYPTSRESYYSSSSKQPADSYDRDRDMDDSHHDTSAWTPRKDNKDYSRSRWGVKDGRGGQRSDRGRGGYDMNDRFNDSRNRDDLNSRDRQRDNGWGSRRSTNGEAIANTLSSTFSDHPQDDRTGYSYASAPSSSSRQDAQRKARKKHKKPKTEKRAREWRTDDTHLNKNQSGGTIVLLPHQLAHGHRLNHIIRGHHREDVLTHPILLVDAEQTAGPDVAQVRTTGSVRAPLVAGLGHRHALLLLVDVTLCLLSVAPSAVLGVLSHVVDGLEDEAYLSRVVSVEARA